MYNNLLCSIPKIDSLIYYNDIGYIVKIYIN